MIVDGYVRVSQVGGRSGTRFISPELQREQIERWADRKGDLISHVFEELDESGGRKDRPMLAEAIARIESGESQGLVVAYMSRFGRSLLDGLTAIQRITDAGGTFASVQEGLDFSTDIGRHMLRQMLSWAEWELDRNRVGWDTARERAVARGACLGPTPFGYRRSASNRLEPDPVTGPMVAELFRLRADGVRHSDLRDMLVERGIKSPRGDAYWQRDVVRLMLRRRVYLGESRHGKFVNPDAHPPLIDRPTWEGAQSTVQRLPRHAERPEPLLVGVLRCAGCQRLLLASLHAWGSSEADWRYACGRYDGRSQCPAPSSVRASVVEPYIEALYWQELATTRRPSTPRRIAGLQEMVDRRDRELCGYRDNPHLPCTLGPERFAEGLAVRVRRLEQARLELDQVRRAATPPTLAPNLIREQWSALTNERRGRAIAEVIDSVIVRRGRDPIAQRLHVFRRGQAPAGLPAFKSVAEARHFKEEGCAATVALRPAKPWLSSQVRDALTGFARGMERWPSFPEFQIAGRALLYGQVQQHGGPRWWANSLGLPYVPWLHGSWCDERIRSELAAYLDGKTTWPSAQQFRADNRDLLREAVRATGGPDRWAPLIGVELPTTRATQAVWTYARMRDELAAFVGDRHDWPLCPEFREAGLDRLYQAINRAKARPALAADLALTLPPGRKRIRRCWTDVRIDAALKPFLHDYDTWPRRRDFKDAGLDGLYRVIAESGRRDWWARRNGVTSP